MPIQDAQRWNQRYRADAEKWPNEPHPWLYEHTNLLPVHGLALDAAMGLGANAGYLASLGMDVVGVDISSEAVLQAHRRHPKIMAVIADLEMFRFPMNTFDVILNFYYLERNLFPEYRRILKPGGVLVFETMILPMKAIKPEVPVERLLNLGELPQVFSDWDILADREGWYKNSKGNDKAISSLIARKPVR